MTRSRAWAVTSVAMFFLLAAAAHGGTLPGYSATGQLGLEVTGVSSNPIGPMSSLSGTLSVNQLPAGAIIQKAFVYAGDWNNSGATLDLKFGTSPNLAGNPINSDAAFSTLYGYRWDVTPYVINANMSYSFTIGLDVGLMPQGNQIPGAALAVVWSHPNAGISTVSFVDGALQVGENTPTITDTETMSFSGLPAGGTTLHLFTISDDAVGTGETIDYNNVTVGGPIDENLVLGASLISIGNLTSQSPANNVVSVTSPNDHFGWIFSAVIVPEPATANLLLLAVPLLAAAGWRRARRR